MPKSKRVLVTTGYSAWGMTTSLVSAKLLSDLITGKKNEWESLYSPSRIKKANNKNVPRAGKGGEKMDLKPNEGKIVEENGEKLAVYKDESGKVTAVSAICTHMGCTVGWNNKDKTWDCPCHGSRYDKTGKVIHGPAVKNLSKKEIEL
ncbi:MAG: FAD-dependent oxidoreductase [Candidatus Roizmanbacteria bacterium]|nr:MAG: FAD-dependent oxidoreductase [Candidatus Roizmanbacteria bacterium]